MRKSSKRYSAKKRLIKKLSKKLSRKRLSKKSCDIKVYKKLSKKALRLTNSEGSLLDKLQGTVYLKTKEDGKSFLMPFKLPPGWSGAGTIKNFLGNDGKDN